MPGYKRLESKEEGDRRIDTIKSKVVWTCQEGGGNRSWCQGTPLMSNSRLKTKKGEERKAGNEAEKKKGGAER